MYVPSKQTHIVNSESMPINKGKIFIENHTTYVLEVTIHGEIERRYTVEPKLEDKCTSQPITINCDSVDVTIKNTNCSHRCRGWVENCIVNKGGKYAVHGEPYLIFVQGCTHVL
jgi:hypothetical protein